MKHILFTFICLLLAVQAKAAESGDGWSLSDDGILTISADFSGGWIGDYPWYSYQKSIKTVIINESVTSIGDQAFEDCSSLTSINIPKSVTAIGKATFMGCSSLESIKVDEDNTKYDSRNNCNAIIGTESNTLIAGCQNTIIPEGVTAIENGAFCGCSRLTSINIPEGVTSIGQFAFESCGRLTSINIPEGVTSIGPFAFKSCGRLTSINIPESVTYIGSHAFEYCSRLTSINIPEGVTSIRQNAFYYCNSLTSIKIPKNVTYIGDWAFYGCSNLTNVYDYATTPAELGSKAFVNTHSDLIIYIPKGTTEAYKAAWGNNYNYVEMDEEAPTVEPVNINYDESLGKVEVLSFEDGTITLSITPNKGYRVHGIYVDGERVYSANGKKAASVNAWKNEDGTYSISGVTEHSNLFVSFAIVTPVNEIAAEQTAEIIAVYSPFGIYVGKSLENLQNGLYVVVYSNGETDKVLVK